eukprot:6097456-Prymnesium_polylepis.1
MVHTTEKHHERPPGTRTTNPKTPELGRAWSLLCLTLRPNSASSLLCLTLRPNSASSLLCLTLQQNSALCSHLQPHQDAPNVGAVVAVVEEGDVPAKVRAIVESVEEVGERARPLRRGGLAGLLRVRAARRNGAAA